MLKSRITCKPISYFLLSLSFAAHANTLDKNCADDGWKTKIWKVNNIERKVIWRGPKGLWKSGTILVLHGGGGEAAHFCAGGWLVKPQRQFAEMAIDNGFGVFLLEATTDIVTDEQNRPCGKRFDFSVLKRPNIDLPYIEEIIQKLIPTERPVGSRLNLFMTGLSTGGFMTIRASSVLANQISAFAPIAAGDPYGTDTVCDTSLSKRTSAKGILIDRETKKNIVVEESCTAKGYTSESPWPKLQKQISFKQFHHEKDGLVDLSCLRKATQQLVAHGFRDDGLFLIKSRGRRTLVHHLWQSEYNKPLIDFFKRH